MVLRNDWLQMDWSNRLLFDPISQVMYWALIDKAIIETDKKKLPVCDSTSRCTSYFHHWTFCLSFCSPRGWSQHTFERDASKSWMKFWYRQCGVWWSPTTASYAFSRLAENRKFRFTACCGPGKRMGVRSDCCYRIASQTTNYRRERKLSDFLLIPIIT